MTLSQLAQFSLVGICKHVMSYAKDYDIRAEKVKGSFKTWVLPLVAEFPQLKIIPLCLKKKPLLT